MAKKTLADLTDLHGKKVLIRCDFNVPLDDAGNITNDRRIRAAVPTIQRVLDGGASAIVMSHLGRPKGDPVKDAPFKLGEVALRLQQLLNKPVQKVDEVVGSNATLAVQELQPGEVLLLENLRFDPREQKGDADFARQIAAFGDVYVNDAFGTCHRSDASMVAVPQAMAGKPRVVGLLVAKELKVLDNLLSSPARPFLGILGGAKVSDKIGFIKALLAKVDKVLVGGAMSYTFMKAQNRGIGSSKVEADKLDLARELLAVSMGKIVLPLDHVVIQKTPDGQSAKVSFIEGDIPEGGVGVDIGPKTQALYKDEIGKAATVVWNGPMGKYEEPPYDQGTRAVAEAMAASKGVTVVGGGETAEAVEDFGLAEKMTHVSTGGGAFLEYVEGTPFAALAQIDDK
jgi:phosphoglycerate kinase